MTRTQNTVRPITGRFVLITVVSFFLVVIGVNVVMMRLAVLTLPGTWQVPTVAGSNATNTAVNNVSAMSPVSAPIQVASLIFADDFSTGDLSLWTSVTRLTIDGTQGSPAAPSALGGHPLRGMDRRLSRG